MNVIIIRSIMTIVTGLLFAVFGLVLERWFVKCGFAPDSTASVVIVAFGSVVIKQLWFEQVTWWVFTPIIILSMTLGVHRGDFWRTLRQGKWWWKSENDNR